MPQYNLCSVNGEYNDQFKVVKCNSFVLNVIMLILVIVQHQ